MRFCLDAEQAAFGRTLDAMFGAADTPSAIRAWARGEPGPGLDLWERAARAGVFALSAGEEYGGVGPLPVEVAVAFVELGRHGVPGPLVETVAAAALLGHLAGRGLPGPAGRWLPRVCAGRAVLTLAVPAVGPYALDAEVAEAVLVATGGELRLAGAVEPGPPSLDPARRLARPCGGGELLAAGPALRGAAGHAADWAAFATAAQALGVGYALLDRTVAHARRRVQFGVAIGSFQAVKHRLADVFIGLEFARPLLYGAAVALAGCGTEGSASAEVAAAKVAACEAAYAAARTALQVHGAIGYTAEYDLSLWIGRARALRYAWGAPSECRARVLGG